MKDFKDWNIDDFTNVIDMQTTTPIKSKVRIIHYRIKKGAKKMPIPKKLEYCKLEDVL